MTKEESIKMLKSKMDGHTDTEELKKYYESLSRK